MPFRARFNLFALRTTHMTVRHVNCVSDLETRALPPSAVRLPGTPPIARAARERKPVGIRRNFPEVPDGLAFRAVRAVHARFQIGHPMLFPTFLDETPNEFLGIFLEHFVDFVRSEEHTSELQSP